MHTPDSRRACGAFGGSPLGCRGRCMATSTSALPQSEGRSASGGCAPEQARERASYLGGLKEQALLRVQERRLRGRHAEHAAIEGVDVCGSVDKLSSDNHSTAFEPFKQRRDAVLH